MAGGRKKRSGKKKASAGASAGGTAAEGKVFDLVLENCSTAFWEASSSQQCPAELDVAEEGPESTPSSCSGTIVSHPILVDRSLWWNTVLASHADPDTIAPGRMRLALAIYCLGLLLG